MNALTVGEAIRRIRKRLGKNTKDFGMMVGSTSASISRYENGKMPPSRSMAMLLASFAETEEEKAPLRALVEGVKEPSPGGNPIAEIRLASRMAPAVFAAVIGVTGDDLRLLEDGLSQAPPRVLENIKTVAVTHRRPDLAVALGDWVVRHVVQPGETLITAGKVDRPRAVEENTDIQPSNHQMWHDLLDEILTSTDEDAVIAVQHNLVVFGKTVRLGRKSEPKKKSG